MMANVTKDTTLEKVLKIPGADKVLEKFNTPCMHCPMAAYEMGQLKLGDIAGAYGIDLKGLLADLKKLETKSKGKK
jgi:hypothetical protein